MFATRVSLALPAALLLWGAALSQAADPDYYPLAVGNEWEYKLVAGGKELKMTTTIARKETVDGVELFVLEGKSGGKVAATEHLKHTAEGLLRYRNNGMAAEPPFKLLPYPVKAQATWKGDLTTGGVKTTYAAESAPEEVTVPAGTYKTIRVKFDLPAEKAEVTYWFAENVGFVKQHFKLPGLEVTLTLEEFTPAK